MSMSASGSSTPSLLPQGSAPPLYAFSLPQEILHLLALRSPLGGQAAVPSPEQQQEAHDEQDGRAQPAGESASSDALDSAGLGCSLCRSNRFEGIQDQRHHFSSDWHRYNVKRRLASKPAVNEEEWEGMVEGLSDSLTGSASSSSDEESSASERDETLINRVLAKQKISTNAMDDEQPDFASPRSPLLWFETPHVLKDMQLGIYRAIFPSALKKAHSTATTPWLDELRELQVNEDTSRLGKKSLSKSAAPPTDIASRTWAMFAMGGGHFAGAIFSLVPRLNNQGHNRIIREVVCLQSKTFHRYTTRRKQGGSQAANDNAKGNAKSVGAQLRRANEAALVDDIRGLLDSWKDQIANSEIVWLRTSKTNHRVFYDYEEAVLQKKDPRIRGFPFPTRRPTQAELVRCFDELTRVKLSHLTAVELAELDEAYRAAMMPKKPTLQASKEPAKPAAPEVPKLSKEEVLERDRWERLVDMVRRGRLEPLKGFLEKQAQEMGGSTEEASKKWLGALPSWMADERRQSPTVLHVAASSDQPDVVRWLLAEQHVDPTLSFLSVETPMSSAAGNGCDGSDGGAIAPSTGTPLSQRTAYECASSRGVRNVFRRAYADFPDLWDWQNGARVPSQLTEEMESAQSAKTNVRKSALKQKMRERQSEREVERAMQEAEEEKKRLAQEAEEKRKRAEQPTSGPQRLGGAAPRKVQQMTELKGLTEEQQRRIERERRAKAAEARMAASSG